MLLALCMTLVFCSEGPSRLIEAEEESLTASDNENARNVASTRLQHLRKYASKNVCKTFGTGIITGSILSLLACTSFQQLRDRSPYLGTIRWRSTGKQNPKEWYCPTYGDFTSDGGATLWKNGWRIANGGGVHGKTSYNLLNGGISFDMDLENAQPQVNTNLYLISPRLDDWRVFTHYCDIQPGPYESCMELDIIENNGNCRAQATVHTLAAHQWGECDQGGCWDGWRLPSPKIHVVATFDEDGTMTVNINNEFNSTPELTWSAKETIVKKMREYGAKIESSQWVGWVPAQNQCPYGGNLQGSSFSVNNVRIHGRWVWGPKPTQCDANVENF